METCIFCKIAAKEIPSAFVWEDENFFAFLDIHPVNPGHMLVIPKEHISYVFDMPDELYDGLFSAAKKLSGSLKDATGAKRIGLAIEGFGVDHVHLHMIPVNAANDLNPLRAKPADQNELAEMTAKIQSLLK